MLDKELATEINQENIQQLDQRIQDDDSELSDVDVKNFQEWSEGNKYLFELLCNCKKNGIETFASCGGHEMQELLEKHESPAFPYIGISINSKSLESIKRIIFELKDMDDINMDTGFLKDAVGGRSFCIKGTIANCCELFYRINSAIVNTKDKDAEKNNSKNIFKSFYRYLKAMKLYSSAKNIANASEEEIRNEDIKECYFENMSKDAWEYYTSAQDIFDWSKVGEQRATPRFEKLNEKYGHLQKEYYPRVETEPVALLESGKEEKLPSWDLRNWSQEELLEAKKLAKESEQRNVENKIESDKDRDM